ncbi:ATP-binding protein [Rhizobium sp. CSW-27]|uniref:ATP-binding protein n=1 Tax=Rhizobium sp. CSW-27 TaxID=2839985 RepID=UPI001C010D6B|nr:ATP-binding protein [Rhizobium sp. CSW-27]MBT9371372.1 AAA family ATPase [Rhizobium sp. CSW-27]
MTIEMKNVLELADAALSADYTRVRRAANALARDLDKNGETSIAKELKALVRKRGVPLKASGYMESLPVDSKSRLPLVEEQTWPDTPIFLNESGWRVFSDFIADARRIDDLSAKGLASRLGLLLSGPPGTGKSLLAGHIAAQLSRPLYVVRLDSVISSLLGDTAKNIRSVFDFVPARNAVLFLDEMDAVAKLRDDRHELGELKRVVNTVIQALDGLDPSSIVVAATNHAHLLDPAIWRRFPYKIDLGLPEESVRADLWRHFLFEDNDEDGRAELFATVSEGLSGADIETMSLSARRHAVHDSRDIDFGAVIAALLEPRSGRTAPVQRQPLDAEQKRQVAMALKEKHGIAGADTARILGVSRQAIYAYLKQQDGEA